MLKGRERDQGQKGVSGRRVWAGHENPGNMRVKTIGKDLQQGSGNIFLRGQSVRILTFAGQEVNSVSTTPLHRHGRVR